jgi:polygalacturonase
MNTDRGLRVKTRRGRGKLSVLDDISFENIDMDNVMTPFVVNSFYFCDSSHFRKGVSITMNLTKAVKEKYRFFSFYNSLF